MPNPEHPRPGTDTATGTDPGARYREPGYEDKSFGQAVNEDQERVDELVEEEGGDIAAAERRFGNESSGAPRLAEQEGTVDDLAVAVDTTSRGASGHRQLVTGESLSLRMWDREEPCEKEAATRPYEVVGYVIDGRAELEVEGRRVDLTPGVSWTVPAEANHRYRILETFTAVEAVHPVQT